MELAGSLEPIEADVDKWKRELTEAGWTAESATAWRSPNGGLYRGPYGAWAELQRQQEGLYPEGKFIVQRRDGSDCIGRKHENCEYFVLDLMHDPKSVPALEAYAWFARRDGYEMLATDLENKINELKTKWQTPKEQGQ